MAIFKVTAVPDFSQLKGEIAKLQSSPVTLGVDTQQANVNINATRQSLQKLTETFSPEGELRRSVASYSRQVGEVVQVSKSLNAQTGEMDVTSKKVTQNFEAQAKAAQKAAAQVQAAKDAYRAYAAQQSSTYAPTAMQSRIESLTGVSGLSGKSARESAAAFEKAWLNASDKVQGSADKAAQKVKSVGQAAKESSGFAGLMGDSFVRVAGKMALWQVMGNAIAGVKRSFTEALETMKAVDDEMVTIRKVTGATAAELNKIEKQAYDTASAYGVAADEYLQFVSGFSRAGYGEQASALAELAAKTQIVGDTNAETAQQFLLSVDAAYKYQGNIEQLTKVLDGANEIDNKYATSIQKIAEGLGKVAPIAAQAHVGVDELAAGIGTITAVTQRSGTEASTALRALFLNIIGDTKTEIDEGVTWTTGEIAGLRDVIKVYAKDAYDAAQATGSVINPMKAIAGLSKSMKDGLLTEQQLMEMVSDIGGKLRTSQLLALIQNWDMYQSMLGDFADAAGSADKEVENALDSWTRKTEILHNKWTQFVSNLVETDTIKDALDGVIGLVEFLDSDTGRLVVQLGLLVGVLTLANKGFTALMNTGAGTFFGTLTAAIGGDAMAITQLTGQMKDLLVVLPKLGVGAAIFAALAVAISLSTEKARAYEKALEDVETAQGALDETKSEYDELINKTGELTDAEKKRLEVLKELRQEQEKQLEAAQHDAWEAWDAAHGSGASVVVGGAEGVGGGLGVGAVKTERMDIVALRDYREELAEIAAQYQIGEMSAGAYYDALEQLNAAREESVETIRAAILAGYEVTDEQRELVAAYDRVQQILGVASDATAKYVSGLVEEAQQSGKTEKELYDLVAAQITASNTKLNFSQQIMALQQLALQAGYAGNALANTFALAGINETNLKRTAAGLMQSGKYSSYEAAYAEALRRTQSSMLYQFSKMTSTAPSGDWGGTSYTPSGGSSSSAAKSKQNELDNARKKAAQATIDAIKKQRDAETDAIDEQIDALKKQNEETERGEKLEELKLNILKKQDELLNARNERTVRQYNAATGQWEWVADAQKVKDAEEALEDAKKDLRDYERDTERELAIEELEARKKAIEAAYQLKIDTWQKLIDELNGDVETEKALLAASRGDWETYYQEMLKVYQKLLDAAQDYEDKKQEIQNSGNTGGDNNNDGGSDSGDDGGKGNDTDDDNKSSPVSEVDSLTPAQRIIYDMWMSRGVGTYEALRQAKKNASDKVKDSFDKTAEPSKDYEKTTVGKLEGLTKKDTGSSGNTSGSGTKKPSGGGNTLGGGKNVNKVSQYDSGGVLHGLGGIKATVDDEMVLPPDVTRKLLTPAADSKAMEVIAGMRLALNDRTPYGKSLAGVTNNSTDSHDVSYCVNGVPISADMAKLPMEQIVRQLNMAAFQGQVFNGW
nr:MAG TPA: minor tail protein [Bacteriophage sp.]